MRHRSASAPPTATSITLRSNPPPLGRRRPKLNPSYPSNPRTHTLQVGWSLRRASWAAAARWNPSIRSVAECRGYTAALRRRSERSTEPGKGWGDGDGQHGRGGRPLPQPPPRPLPRIAVSRRRSRCRHHKHQQQRRRRPPHAPRVDPLEAGPGGDATGRGALHLRVRPPND